MQLSFVVLVLITKNENNERFFVIFFHQQCTGKRVTDKRRFLFHFFGPLSPCVVVKIIFLARARAFLASYRLPEFGERVFDKNENMIFGYEI